jgi:hypothetical protein
MLSRTLHVSYRNVSYRSVGRFVAMADCLMLVVISIFSAIVYHVLFMSGIPPLEPYIGTDVVASVIFCSLAASAGLYQPAALLSRRTQTTYVLSFWFIVILVFALVVFLLKIGSSYSRGSLISFALLGFFFLLYVRFLAYTVLNIAISDGSLGGYRAIVVGDQPTLGQLSQIDILRKSGAREIARFQLPTSRGSAEFDHATLDKAMSQPKSSARRPDYLDAKVADLLAESVAVQPQEIGCTDLIAAGCGKSRGDEREFHLAQNARVKP